jgi:hypothetical protein
MSLTEAAQEAQKARRDGHPIRYWVSQTRTGDRMLSYPCLGEIVTAEALAPRLPRLVGCPVCKGFGCVCCRWSGILRNRWWERWQQWQLDSIARDVQTLREQSAA